MLPYCPMEVTVGENTGFGAFFDAGADTSTLILLLFVDDPVSSVRDSASPLRFGVSAGEGTVSTVRFGVSTGEGTVSTKCSTPVGIEGMGIGGKFSISGAEGNVSSLIEPFKPFSCVRRKRGADVDGCRRGKYLTILPTSVASQ